MIRQGAIETTAFWLLVFSSACWAQQDRDGAAVEDASVEAAAGTDDEAVQIDASVETESTADATDILPQGDTPSEYLDPAFERYIDIRILHDARKQMDAGLLTDAALQLAEGEKVLLRPHKLVSSKSLLKLATQWCAEKGDEANLKRLATVAERSGDKELVETIAAKKKLGKGSRGIADVMRVSLNTSLEDYATFRHYLLIARDARMLNDSATLDALREELRDSGLNEKQRAHVESISGATRGDSEMSKADQETADVLNKLGADSRMDRRERRRQIASQVLHFAADLIAQQQPGGGGIPGGGMPGGIEPDNGGIVEPDSGGGDVTDPDGTDSSATDGDGSLGDGSDNSDLGDAAGGGAEGFGAVPQSNFGSHSLAPGRFPLGLRPRPILVRPRPLPGSHGRWFYDRVHRRWVQVR